MSLDLQLGTITNLRKPEHWDCVQPNFLAKIRAVMFVRWLHDNGIKDIIIAPTIESGVYLRFSNKNEFIAVECYNDGDIGAIYCNGGKIVDVFDYTPERAWLNNELLCNQ